MECSRDIRADENGDVRQNTAWALGSIGTKDAVPALIQLLQDQDENIRKDTAKALDSIGTPEALKAVEEYQSQQ